ncbi:SAICAR synthase-like protein [Teratosphaeria nubilosa]|uniref:Kinase n=1 Tax=Teratosphaeria nubilosa TaxID=161662 RepID=A0A6G1LJL6_9PEZI|nr:SAICAR synthase-like protein [Teratosphaeria nubilosa]
MADKTKLDSSTLKAFENAAAGHQGVLSDANGELIIKPCTQAEIDFYQQTLLEHTEFSELIPEFMGTLHLGATAQVADATTASELLETAQSQPNQKRHGDKLLTETAIVLGNLEHGFKRPNVLDLKLGAKLYDESTTTPEKAERLDKVATETTSGSLNFRIAGMKVWNGKSFDLYDKYYGRKFNADNVKDGFARFFSGLSSSLRNDEAAELLETIDAEIAKARHVLEKSESRMYSASLLIVYEGDADAMETIMGGSPKTPKVREKAPKPGEVEQSREEEEDEEDDPPVAFQVKMIDFAHAAWTPGKGRDENVIKGLRSIESQLDGLITQLTHT